MICPLGRKICRHCSEIVIRTVQRVGVIKTGTYERRETSANLGAWCNNDGRHFVRELKECPQPAPGSVPLVMPEISELEWMRRRTA